MSNLLTVIIKEKCPYCEKGNVYKEKTSILKLPEMNSNCPSCGKDLIGEPGYFFGAMYVSYGIAVFAGILTFVCCRFLLKIESFELIVTIIMTVILLISFKNFKWSRIFWLKVFPPGPGTNFQKKHDTPLKKDQLPCAQEN